MPSRFEFERAIRYSELPAPARHVALTIATWADVKTGRVPARHTPSLSTLAEATGLGRSTVRRGLNALESEGWIGRDRPDPVAARTKQARTRYRLRVPKGVDVPANGGQEEAPEDAEPRAAAAPGEEGLGPERPQGRAAVTPDLGPERAQPRATAAPKSSYGPTVHNGPPARASSCAAEDTLFPVDEPPKPVTAQTLVGEWIERCGYTPPERITKRVGKEAKALLDEGIDPDNIRRGMALWMQSKSTSPAALPNFVNEAMNVRHLRQPADPRFRGGARSDIPTHKQWANGDVEINL